MKSIRQQLTEAFVIAFQALSLPESGAAVVPSDRPELAHFQCNGAFQAAKIIGQTPYKVAQLIVNQLAPTLGWAVLSVAEAGFINILLTDTYLCDQMNLMLEDKRLGSMLTGNPQRICIDFGGPNIAKPLHVGHLRSGIIGDSLQRLNRFVGHQVTSDIHLGDWGTQMGMVICGIRQEQPDLPYFVEGAVAPFPDNSPVSVADLERIYPAESARCKRDPKAMAEALQATRDLQSGRAGYLALWQHFTAISIASARTLYDRLDIQFDRWDGESTVNARIPAMLKRLQASGKAYLSEGALIIALSSPPPLLLQKSDGAYLYATTDLATLEARVERGAQIIYYVVDKRQDLHFRQLFEAARLIGMVDEKIVLQFHGYGTVNGADGKPFKTRDGGVMRLEELIRLVEEQARLRLTELGIAKDYPHDEQELIVKKVASAALKFADLINNKSSDYIFDLERFTAFEGKTGPYLIYTAVRARSVLRTVGLKAEATVKITQTGTFERRLLLAAAAFPETINDAVIASAPHILCDYAFRLSQEYNRFYQQCNILHEADLERQKSWLAITLLFCRQIELLCTLIGVEIPERM